MTRPARQPHREPLLLLLVAAGGAVGSLLRWSSTLLLPEQPGSLPWATFAVNVVGAFLLGWLLESLARRGPETPRLRQVRLFAGTGVLGGFTTYSAFALQLTVISADGYWPVALAYAVATLVLGTLAALLGVLVGHRMPQSIKGRLLRGADRSGR